MDRRVSGGLILVMALLVALVVPKVLNPTRVDGVAGIAPPPAPPVVGDCIAQSASGYSMSDDGQLEMVQPVTIVPCSTPHGGEIIRVDDPPLPVDRTGEFGRGGDLLSSCWSDSFSVWATTSDGWIPQTSISIGVVGPDARQTAAGQSWNACSVGKYNGRLDGSLAALSPDGAVPPELGLCSIQDHNEPGRYTESNCTEPHDHEDLGYRELPAGSPLTQDAAVESCADLAVRSTGRSDVATDPAVVIETGAWAWFESGDSVVTTLPLPADAGGGGVTCAVHTADGRQLTSSLRQLGDGPLPWAS